MATLQQVLDKQETIDNLAFIFGISPVRIYCEPHDEAQPFDLTLILKRMSLDRYPYYGAFIGMLAHEFKCNVELQIDPIPEALGGQYILDHSILLAEQQKIQKVLDQNSLEKISLSLPDQNQQHELDRKYKLALDILRSIKGAPLQLDEFTTTYLRTFSYEPENSSSVTGSLS